MADTAELIDYIVDQGMKAFKKLHGNCEEGRKLSRHEPVEMDGFVFTYWREFVVYKMAQYIQEMCPSAEVEIDLCGNDTSLKVGVTDGEQESLDTQMEEFIRKVKSMERF